MKALLASSFVLLLVAGVAAQEIPTAAPNCFAGSGPNPLPANQQLTVEYHNASQQPGTTVHITVRSLTDPSQFLDYTITLNNQQSGSFTCNPPQNWGGVVLEATGSQDMTIPFTFVDGAACDAAEAESEPIARAAEAVCDRRRAALA